jgi:hypothetical protein
LATSKAGNAGRERKSQRQKYEDKVKTWELTIPGADKIEFDLVQESDLLDELAMPEHYGRRWFWWGDREMGRNRGRCLLEKAPEPFDLPRGPVEPVGDIRGVQVIDELI